jgi:transcription termination factor Rho
MFKPTWSALVKVKPASHVNLSSRRDIEISEKDSDSFAIRSAIRQALQDIFVTPEIVRRFGLRDGMWIYGETRRNRPIDQAPKDQ